MKTALIALAAALIALGTSVSQAQTPARAAARLGVRVECNGALSGAQCRDGVNRLSSLRQDDVPSNIRRITVGPSSSYSVAAQAVTVAFDSDHSEISNLLATAHLAILIHGSAPQRPLVMCLGTLRAPLYQRCYLTMLALYVHRRRIPRAIDTIFIGSVTSRVGRALTLNHLDTPDELATYLDSLGRP